MSVNFLTLDHHQHEDPFMNETLTMSKTEREKLHYMRLLTMRGISIADAAQELGLSERQCYRLLKTYKDKGDEGLIHGLRGCKSNAAYTYDQKQKVIALYREKYDDYGPTLFSEKVEEVYDLTINRETLRQWLMKKGLWKQERKAEDIGRNGRDVRKLERSSRLMEVTMTGLNNAVRRVVCLSLSMTLPIRHSCFSRKKKIPTTH